MTGAKRKSEVRGLAKRHSQHVRFVVGNESCLACSERGTSPPTSGPTGRRNLPPGHSLRSLGGPTSVVATPAEHRSVIVGSPRSEGPAGGKVPATGAKRKSEVRGLAKRHRQHVRFVVGNESCLACSERGTSPPTSPRRREPSPDTRFARWGDRPPWSQPPQDRRRSLSVPLRSEGPRGKVPATSEAEVGGKGAAKRHRQHVRFVVGNESALHARRGERAPLPPTLRAQEPSPRTLHFVPLGRPTSVVSTPAKPDTRCARWGDRSPSRNPRKSRTLASLVGGTDLRGLNPRRERRRSLSVPPGPEDRPGERFLRLKRSGSRR